ncbi:MAG TPA: hypothetical protein VFZ25_08030, partial [Chloroflexota bacterium]|nr:hypothetical protein [Chloroflexota bacterium]
SRPPGAALGFVAEDASRSIMAAADAGPELAVQPTSTTVAPDARGALAVPNEVEIPVPPLLDLTIARAARRAQVVEITIDWIPGADPWDEPEQLEAARETARSFEDEGIQIIFRRGRELPAASYDPGRGLQPFDFAVVGPAGPVLLDALVLLDRANLITQRPGALEVVLAPVALPNRFDSARPMPELVYSDGLEGDAEAAAEVNGPGAVVPATAGARPREARPTVGEAAAANVETVQMVVDWVAGQDPWHGLAERTSELVHRLERQGIRLEFVAGRPVSPAEYAEAPAQPASEFVLPTGHGPVSLGDAAWLNQAVLRRQRPGLMHVLLAPQPVSPRERAFEPVLPELTFAESEVEGGEDPAGTAATIARRGDAQTPTIAPSILPSLPSTMPTAPATSPLGGASRELTALPLTPAARIETSTKSAAPTTTPGLVPLRREPVPPARDGADPFARGWPPFLGEGSEEWAPPDDQPLDVRVSGRSGLGARRAGQERPLALPGEFAAEVVERSEDGLGAGPARGVAGQSTGLGDLGLDSGRPSGATARPLWDNTTAMSLLVYDITTVDGESEPSRSSGARAGGWPAGPAIGSALTYVHEGQEREPSQVPSVDRFNGYVIPSTLVYVSEGELMTAEPRQAARAAADRQPVSTGSSVQRVVTDTAATPEGGSTQQSPNLETLAREVYREIKWRLVVEHERAGTRRPTRGW